MPAIRARQLQIQKSTFITPDNHYVLFYKISFGADPVNRFGLGFNGSAETVFYCLMLHLVIALRLAWWLFALFLLLLGCGNTVWIEPAKFMAARGSVSNPNLLYNKVKAIPLLMTECQGLA